MTEHDLYIVVFECTDTVASIDDHFVGTFDDVMYFYFQLLMVKKKHIDTQNVRDTLINNFSAHNDFFTTDIARIDLVKNKFVRLTNIEVLNLLRQHK